MIDDLIKNSGLNADGPASVSALEDKFSSGIFRSPSDKYQIELPDRHLSPDSVVLLQSYHEAYRRLFKNGLMMEGPLATGTELDFSLLISPLSKILETELNLSVAQWFRAQVGIPMPAYYHRDMEDWTPTAAQAGEYSSVEVDFCRKNMTIGGIIKLLRHHGGRGTLPAWITRHAGFTDTCDRLRKTRNTAAHGGYATRKDFEDTHAAFTELADGGAFASLAALRDEMMR